MKELIESIKKIEQKTASKEWLEGLEDRKREEAEFHDFSHDHDTELGNKKFYKTTQYSSDYLDNWIKTHSKDKIFLDYACGNGVDSVRSAKYGAKMVIGLDISAGSVSNSKMLAKKNGVADRCHFVVGDCENTGLPDDSIDVVLCNGMLHHINLDYGFPELYRILKPGGIILGREALNYNPIIRAYRMRTPEMRTEWEKHHILSLKDVEKAKKYFSVGEIKYFHITSFLAAFLRKSPAIMKPVLSVLNGLDTVLTKIPYIQRMAWQFTFELIKEKKKEE